MSGLQINAKTEPCPTLEELLFFIENLPPEERYTLIEKLISKQAGFSVVFRNQQFFTNLLTHISQMLPEQLNLILDTIAVRVMRESL